MAILVLRWALFGLGGRDTAAKIVDMGYSNVGAYTDRLAAAEVSREPALTRQRLEGSRRGSDVVTPRA